MDKKDIVLRIYEKVHNLKKKEIGKVIDAFLECMKESICLEDEIEIKGFGTFSQIIIPTKFVNRFGKKRIWNRRSIKFTIACTLQGRLDAYGRDATPPFKVIKKLPPPTHTELIYDEQTNTLRY